VTWDKEMVDAMTARMVNRPASLDTIVATNLHADILSDLAAALAGSLESGRRRTSIPNARTIDVRADSRVGLRHYGQGHCQSGGTFWTVAMMLEHLGEPEAARRLMQPWNT